MILFLTSNTSAMGVKKEWCLLPMATIILSNQLVVDIVREISSTSQKKYKNRM